MVLGDLIFRSVWGSGLWCGKWLLRRGEADDVGLDAIGTQGLASQQGLQRVFRFELRACIGFRVSGLGIFGVLGFEG